MNKKKVKILILGESEVGKTTFGKMLSIVSGEELKFADTSTIWLEWEFPFLNKQGKDCIRTWQEERRSSDKNIASQARENLTKFYDAYGKEIAEAIFTKLDIYAGARQESIVQTLQNFCEKENYRLFCIYLSKCSFPLEQNLQAIYNQFTYRHKVYIWRNYKNLNWLERWQSFSYFKKECEFLLQEFQAAGLLSENKKSFLQKAKIRLQLLRNFGI